MMLNDLSLALEGRRLRGEEWVFQQDNAAITNKEVLAFTKIRLLHHPACSTDLNAMENLWGLIVAKVFERDRQYSTISQFKNTILDAEIDDSMAC